MAKPRQTLEERIIQLGYVKPMSAIEKLEYVTYSFLTFTLTVAAFVLF